MARTTPEERAVLKETIVGVYNAVFEDHLEPDDIHLNQLHSPDNEADIYLPEIGINVELWRRWSDERRLEVLLHEFAHVEDYEDDHAPSFYDRLVELVGLARDRPEAIEEVFGVPIDFDAVERHVVRSVHEDTIEGAVDSVEDRRTALRSAFDRDG